MEAEIAVMQPQVKDTRTGRNHQKLGDTEQTSSLILQREHGPADTRISHSGFQNCESINFYVQSHQNCVIFFTTTLKTYYINFPDHFIMYSI